jgi:[DsrC]-trisulfide reductase subunit M
MNVLTALVAVCVLVALGFVGGQVEGLRFLFGILLPYAAIVIFLAGIVYRVLRWSSSPVPFRITTTAGQQKSLPWIKHETFDSPFTGFQTMIRMLLEILVFRSLFRNTKAELREGPRFVYGEEKWLWLAAIAFHWSFLFVFLRHLRFFMEPVPACLQVLELLDGFFQIGAPVLLWTGVILLASLLYLLARRLFDPQVRYMSLVTDYFALFVLISLAFSGILMRYFDKVDIIAIKQLGIGLVTLSPVVPASIGSLFFVHLFMLSVLIAYFPFSKLMHMPGVFLSPTRNLANNNRAKRHINPWNPDVKVHTYEEWEEEFHDKIVAAGLPLDKEE